MEKFSRLTEEQAHTLFRLVTIALIDSSIIDEFAAADTQTLANMAALCDRWEAKLEINA